MKITTYTILMLTIIGLSNTSNAQTFQWAKQMGGAADYDIGISIATDVSGNVYTVGNFGTTADFDPGPGTFYLTSAGANDVFISKVDPSGNFVWAKRIGGVDTDEGLAIALDPSGNVYATGVFRVTADFDPSAGVFNLTSAGDADIFILKLDASGNFLWAKQMGGIVNDFGFSIALDASNNVYATGSFGDTADFDPGIGTFDLISAGNTDNFVSKLDSNGNFLWAKQLGGTDDDDSYAIAVDAIGNVYTIGTFYATADFDPGVGTYNLTAVGQYDIFISKLDASGNFSWAKQIGGAMSDEGYAIAVDASGNVFTTGSFAGIVDFDPGAGTFNLTAGLGNLDVFVSKLDVSGNFLWARQFGGMNLPDGGQGRSIALDAFNNVYTTGFFTGTVDFDPGAATFNLTSAGAYDIYISRLDAYGNFVWAINMGGTDYEVGRGLALDTTGNVYSTGAFGGTADFDPGVGIFNLTTGFGNGDIYISKIGNTITGISEPSNSFTVNIYPNPTNRLIHFTSLANVQLMTITGQVIASNKSVMMLDISEIPQGIYFILLTDSKGEVLKTGKIVKE
jgi:hypothetical protein